MSLYTRRCKDCTVAFRLWSDQQLGGNLIIHWLITARSPVNRRWTTSPSTACAHQSACVCYLYYTSWMHAETSWWVTRPPARPPAEWLLHPVDASHYGSASYCDVGHVAVMYMPALFLGWLLSSPSRRLPSSCRSLTSTRRLARVILPTNGVISRQPLALLERRRLGLGPSRYLYKPEIMSARFKLYVATSRPVDVLHSRRFVVAEVHFTASVETIMTDRLIISSTLFRHTHAGLTDVTSPKG